MKDLDKDTNHHLVDDLDHPVLVALPMQPAAVAKQVLEEKKSWSLQQENREAMRERREREKLYRLYELTHCSGAQGAKNKSLQFNFKLNSNCWICKEIGLSRRSL